MALADSAKDYPSAKLLQQSLSEGRLAHAYLFAGNNLSKLDEFARTLAKTLNCENPPARGKTGLPINSCDACSTCKKIQADLHPDVVWLRPESKSRVITIDQIRDLLQTVYLKPTHAGFKVAVIVAADRLNVQAANAFLKTLEEPPSKSVLILTSISPELVLETIVSRCLRLTFGTEQAQHIALTHSEWITQFALAAATPENSLLSRYRLLGVLLSRLTRLKSEIETALSAQSPLERHEDIDPKLREKWEDELSASIEAEYRRQRGELLLALQWWLRDVWLHTLSLDDSLLAFESLNQPARTVANRLSADDALENIRALEDTQRLLGSNVQEALALEVGLLRLKL